MARNKVLNQKMKDERRKRILSRALKLFSTKGLAATKITDIASASEMSQGLLYHYYHSKEEIFTELIRHAFERMNAAARELERLPAPPVEKLKMAIEGLLRGLEENEDSARYHLLIAQATASQATPEAARQIIERENRTPYEVMARIIREGQRDGTIRQHDADELALVFWTSINGLAIYRASHGDRFKAPDSKLLMSIFK